MPSTNTLSQAEENKRKTRLLLALWALGGAKHQVKRTEVTDRAKRKKQSTKDYQEYLKELETVGAIRITTQKRVELVFLTDKGLELLGEALKSSDFAFDEGRTVGTWAANALLEWIGKIDNETNSKPAPQSQLAKDDKSSEEFIASYEEFKEMTLETYDKLNRDEKLNDLVPIYQIRRHIGDRVDREYFDSWLLEMQANDILQLQGGTLPDNDPTKIKDSIETELSGLRCYAKLLNS